MPIRIAILDDHQIVIDGLKLLLAGQENFQIVSEHTRGYDLLETLKQKKIDLVLTDIMMPDMDGYEVAIRIKKDFPEVKVLALSMNGEGVLVDKMIEQADIAGYLLKTSDKKELIQAIEEVSRGNTYFAKEILSELKSFQKIKKENEQINLTTREIEIIQCIAQDLSNKQIADQLFISERTVETHRKNIFRKTNIHSAMSLVDFAKKRKII
ncbi:MAG: response regulator transcription factor [Chitinophagaceae bacterium]|nr:response regulator transcription factor [Chitinophagaceae bacterium]